MYQNLDYSSIPIFSAFVIFKSDIFRTEQLKILELNCIARIHIVLIWVGRCVWLSNLTCWIIWWPCTLFTLLFLQLPQCPVASSVGSYCNNFRTSFSANLWISSGLNGRSLCKLHSIFWEIRTFSMNFPQTSPCPTRTFSLRIQIRSWSSRKCWKRESRTTRNRRWIFWQSREIWNMEIYKNIKLIRSINTCSS